MRFCELVGTSAIILGAALAVEPAVADEDVTCVDAAYTECEASCQSDASAVCRTADEASAEHTEGACSQCELGQSLECESGCIERSAELCAASCGVDRRTARSNAECVGACFVASIVQCTLDCEALARVTCEPQCVTCANCGAPYDADVCESLCVSCEANASVGCDEQCRADANARCGTDATEGNGAEPGP